MNPGARAGDNIVWSADPIRETREEFQDSPDGMTAVYTYTATMMDGTEVPLGPYNNRLPLTYGELPESCWTELPPPPPPTLVVPIGKRDIRLS